MTGDRMSNRHWRHLDPIEWWAAEGGWRNRRFRKRVQRRRLRHLARPLVPSEPSPRLFVR
jgi:hypothetical protein